MICMLQHLLRGRYRDRNTAYKHLGPLVEGIAQRRRIQHPLVGGGRLLVGSCGRVERYGSDYTANEPDEVLVTMLSIADPSTKKGSITMTSSPDSTNAIRELRIAAVAPAVTATSLLLSKALS